MQLVVMAAALAALAAPAGAHKRCDFDCHMRNVSIPVESCGRRESVLTTICAGQCFHEDPVYIGNADWAEHESCNGDWSYEVTHIDGCPVTFPVATNCKCNVCNSRHTYCGGFPGDESSCTSF